MSGAAVFTGPLLIGVVVDDPARFGTDRLRVAPVAPVLDGLGGVDGLRTGPVTPVGALGRIDLSWQTWLALNPVEEHPSPSSERIPWRLLLPEYGVVPFHGATTAGRPGLLVRGEDLVAARCVLGQGGSGKTRLARELFLTMADRGWQAGLAGPATAAEGEQAGLEWPLLLLVDEADQETAKLRLLFRRLTAWPHNGPRVRVLLVSRHQGTWWDALVQYTKCLAVETADDPVRLASGLLGADERADQYRAAVTALAPHLPSPRDPAVPDLSDRAFQNPLLVHVRGLLDLLGVAPGEGSDVRDRVLDAILKLERARWNEPIGRLPAPPEAVRHPAVKVALPDSQHRPRRPGRRAARDPGPARPACAVARGRLGSCVVREPFPPPWVDPRGLDLLKEQLLATCPDLTDLVASCYEQVRGHRDRVERLLIELVRADHRPPVAEALNNLLANRRPELVALAVEGSTTGDGLPDLLADAPARHPQPPVAATCADLLPGERCGVSCSDSPRPSPPGRSATTEPKPHPTPTAPPTSQCR